MNTIFDAKGIEQRIFSNSQKLNRITDSKFALGDCEDQMTEVTFEHPIEIIREYRESLYLQRTMRFQSKPHQTVNRNVQLFGILTWKKISLNTVPWYEIRQRTSPFPKSVQEFQGLSKVTTPCRETRGEERIVETTQVNMGKDQVL